MTEKDTVEFCQAAERFWHNYLFILEKNATPESSRRWYRRHLENTLQPTPASNR